MAKAAELRELKEADLEVRLSETRHELFNLRFKLATGALDNSSRIGQVKKDIARMETILRAREIQSVEETESTQVTRRSLQRSRPGLRKASNG